MQTTYSFVTGSATGSLTVYTYLNRDDALTARKIIGQSLEVDYTGPIHMNKSQREMIELEA